MIGTAAANAAKTNDNLYIVDTCFRKIYWARILFQKFHNKTHTHQRSLNI